MLARPSAPGPQRQREPVVCLRAVTRADLETRQVGREADTEGPTAWGSTGVTRPHRVPPRAGRGLAGSGGWGVAADGDGLLSGGWTVAAVGGEDGCPTRGRSKDDSCVPKRVTWMACGLCLPQNRKAFLKEAGPVLAAQMPVFCGPGGEPRAWALLSPHPGTGRPLGVLRPPGDRGCAVSVTCVRAGRPPQTAALSQTTAPGGRGAGLPVSGCLVSPDCLRTPPPPREAR